MKTDNASMKAISEKCIDKRAPSSFARFLSSSTWDPFELNLHRIEYFQSLKQLKTVSEGVISLDDYISEKTGEDIKSAGWVYSHTKHKTVLGQNVVALHYKDAKKNMGLIIVSTSIKKIQKQKGARLKLAWRELRS